MKRLLLALLSLMFAAYVTTSCGGGGEQAPASGIRAAGAGEAVRLLFTGVADKAEATFDMPDGLAEMMSEKLGSSAISIEDLAEKEDITDGSRVAVELRTGDDTVKLEVTLRRDGEFWTFERMEVVSPTSFPSGRDEHFLPTNPD